MRGDVRDVLVPLVWQAFGMQTCHLSGFVGLLIWRVAQPLVSSRRHFTVG